MKPELISAGVALYVIGSGVSVLYNFVNFRIVDSLEREINEYRTEQNALYDRLRKSRPNTLCSSDLNGDSFDDAIVRMVDGGNHVFLGQKGGTYISLGNYLQTQKDSIEARLK